MTAGFAITGGKGFHITFANGVTVSVQFGGGNYCANYHAQIWPPPKEDTESPDAEVAVFGSGGVRSGNWLTKLWKDEGDDVVGYQTPDDVLSLLNWAVNYKEDGNG